MLSPGSTSTQKLDVRMKKEPVTDNIDQEASYLADIVSRFSFCILKLCPRGKVLWSFIIRST